MFGKMKMQFRMTKKLGIKIQVDCIVFYSMNLVSEINWEYSDLKEFDKRMTHIRIDVVKKLFDKMSEVFKVEDEDKSFLWAMVLNNTQDLKAIIRMNEILDIKMDLANFVRFCAFVVSEIKEEYYFLNKFDEKTTKIRIDVIKRLFDKMSDFLKLEAEEEILFWTMVLQKSEELEKDKIIPSHS